MVKETKLIFCFIALLIIFECKCAPRSKTAPQTVYDQKQTGDYNIQLHLKDFQIIALLADDSIGGLGDYDYNYDYSELTVKPATQKPLTESSLSTESTEKPVTLKPSASHPYPILAPSTSSAKPLDEKPSTVSSAPEVLLIEKVTPSSLSLVTEKPAEPSSSTQKIEETPNTPGKIKVQIIESPMSPSVGIVPGEELSSSEDGLPNGEIMQLRRCNSGYSRDKKGRCRRVRRPGAVSPQLPFGISRLASNLASRFRYASPDSSFSSSSESIED